MEDERELLRKAYIKHFGNNMSIINASLYLLKKSCSNERREDIPPERMEDLKSSRDRYNWLREQYKNLPFDKYSRDNEKFCPLFRTRGYLEEFGELLQQTEQNLTKLSEKSGEISKASREFLSMLQNLGFQHSDLEA